ncbi:DUF4279 domain-containing protein [Phyllobacterium sp. P30BS-XVII]|uniref:DUF4279 domain-containing protein n=1 Tax=Phyllobacterium sp. P30BS-XVII TaxID=2587046 RepID=UPI000DDC0D30|nr:DUF4279 domain-containing protein [Phyllobacterium sp. P30BS-XVII]MBA8904069.1 hypothetical protein [Phyllobacterium sp. P30BS-XVII]
MAEVFQSAASVNFAGDDLDVEYVTRLMGAQPHLAYEKGKDHVLPNGKVRVAHTGLWNRKVKYRSLGDLNGQIAELLEPLTQNLDVWRLLSAKYRARIFCGLWLDRNNEGIDLQPETLLAVGMRGVRIELDIYSDRIM